MDRDIPSPYPFPGGGKSFPEGAPLRGLPSDSMDQKAAPHSRNVFYIALRSGGTSAFWDQKGERHSREPFYIDSPLPGGGNSFPEGAPLRGLPSDSVDQKAPHRGVLSDERDQKGERRSREPFYIDSPLLGGGRGRALHHA